MNGQAAGSATQVNEEELRALRLKYQAALSAYQNHVAAIALAQSEDEGVPDELLEKTARAVNDLRIARQQYRDAFFGAAFRGKL